MIISYKNYLIVIDDMTTQITDIYSEAEDKFLNFADKERVILGLKNNQEFLEMFEYRSKKLGKDWLK